MAKEELLDLATELAMERLPSPHWKLAVREEKATETLPSQFVIELDTWPFSPPRGAGSIHKRIQLLPCDASLEQAKRLLEEKDGLFPKKESWNGRVKVVGREDNFLKVYINGK